MILGLGLIKIGTSWDQYGFSSHFIIRNILKKNLTRTHSALVHYLPFTISNIGYFLLKLPAIRSDNCTIYGTNTVATQ